MTQAAPPIRAFVFDAYGTLFDVASPVAACAEALGEPAAALARLWRDKQLQYTWLRTLQGRYADFAQVTADALDFALDTLGIHDAALRQRLLDAYRTPSAYPDAPATLAALHGRGFRLAILSNGTPEWLDTAVRASGLGASLDAVLSADTVGVYKPHPEVYRRPNVPWACRQRRSASSRPMAGTPIPRAPTVCRWCGATVAGRPPKGCLPRRPTKSAASTPCWICPNPRRGCRHSVNRP
jgi:2-haloalkanoic acid dehalogenase type II